MDLKSSEHIKILSPSHRFLRKMAKTSKNMIGRSKAIYNRYWKKKRYNIGGSNVKVNLREELYLNTYGEIWIRPYKEGYYKTHGFFMPSSINPKSLMTKLPAKIPF